ncbi:hypothetical protein UA08_05607 [Talaromyces atroroseus]|uniref:Enoyl reductase (ER) domain-containing protein n=1 Tax=Talaromyces atroroseus TaxID=1441469 RepID=A0A225AX88_TALAT|nr:hypothetical protein UA08_05607 [Talaromyces atroroseus]OKL59065.1 hypothetical protein UA08_05607 [Talaromyces atroroseus]
MTSNTMSQQTRVPRTMQALHLPSSFSNETTPGGPLSLKYETDRPVPKPGANQYLIKVQTVCVSVNECLQGASASKSMRDSGMFLERPMADGIDKVHGLIPGREFCGEVISTPKEDYASYTGPAFKVGQEVMGLLADGEGRDGAAADYVLATENELTWKPQNLAAADVATIPLDALIAWQGLFGYATLDPDDGPCNKPADGPLRVLVTNAGQSEVGKQAIRLLRCQSLFPHHVPNLMGGAGERETSMWVCATGSRDEHDFLRKELGADVVTANADIAAAFRENGWEPVDIVFDCVGVGGALLREAHSPVVVKDHGHVLTPSRAPSGHPEKPSEWDERTEIMNRNLTSEVIDVKPNMKQLAKIAQLVEKGVLRPADSYQVEDLLHGQQTLVHAQKAGAPKAVLRTDLVLSQI